jgi:hypothetical protein
VRTIVFALLPHVRFCVVIREQSPWKLLTRTATPAVLAVKLEVELDSEQLP